jgi:cytochrome c nitrite reductase small subunit
MVLLVGAALAMHGTDQAPFCGACHSMAEAALTHKRSVHAELACNECHAPHNLVAKLPFKSKEGLRDIWATATSSVPDLIHPGGDTRRVTQENCQRCHGATTSTVIMQSKEFCTDCHRHVPHSPKIPVAKRSAADA